MNEQLFKNAVADFDYLNKVFIESAAQVAYNATIFEAALSDEVLTEADEVAAPAADTAQAEEKKAGGFKTALYKALETVKRFAANVFNKIKALINETIAKVNQQSFAKAIKSWEKDNDSLASAADVVPDKLLFLGKSPDAIFITEFTQSSQQYFAGKFAGSVDEYYQTVAAKKLADALNNNYADAKKALGEVKSAADYNKIVSNLTSFAVKNEKAMMADNYLKMVKEQGVFDLKDTTEIAKKHYKDSVAATNNAIKEIKSNIDKGNAEKAAELKSQIAFLQTSLGTIHASFAGYLKWAVASNMQVIKCLKSAKKAAKKIDESVMGLALL